MRLVVGTEESHLLEGNLKGGELGRNKKHSY